MKIMNLNGVCSVVSGVDIHGSLFVIKKTACLIINRINCNAAEISLSHSARLLFKLPAICGYIVFFRIFAEQ
jgi:hypothetical protein